MAYKVIEWNEQVARIEVTDKEKHNHRSFVFDLSLITRDPEPKEIIFQQRERNYLHEWRMSWAEFGKEDTIGDVVLVNKNRFKHTKTEMQKEQTDAKA